jgi:type IV fimbrial biogenesis protein FimT
MITVALIVSSLSVENKEQYWGRPQQGITLIEMMVVISILAILAAIALPSFNDATLSSKLRSYANNFVASAHLARSEAIKQNAVVTLCVSADGASCATGGWQQGWIVLSGTTVIYRQSATAAGYRITESAGLSSLTFQPTGIGATQATLTVCRATPYAGSQERVIALSVTGKPSVTKTATGSCS